MEILKTVLNWLMHDVKISRRQFLTPFVKLLLPKGFKGIIFGIIYDLVVNSFEKKDEKQKA